MALFKASAIALAASSLFSLTSAQTYTKCNPLENSCPPDPALGGAVTADFSQGSSNAFDGTGDTIAYTGGLAQLTVAASGNNPTLISPWYIMFGKVDVLMKTAPGVGMVSSFILQSDDLDEIDWEILGADPTGAQTNYFGRGITGTYNREITVAAPTSQTEYNTYSIEYTPQAITWSINGAVVRTLTPAAAAAAGNPYPQTPMQVRVGAWAGGDPSNSAGTQEWAGGAINYADGPFIMSVKSISVTDYSTGSQYVYTDTSGDWQSIKAVGGTVDVGSSNVKAISPAQTSYAPVPTNSAGAAESGYPFVPSTTNQNGRKGADGAPPASTTTTPPWASLFPSGSTTPTAQYTPPSVSSSPSQSLSTVVYPKPPAGTGSYPSGNKPNPTPTQTSVPTILPNAAGHISMPSVSIAFGMLAALMFL